MKILPIYVLFLYALLIIHGAVQADTFNDLVKNENVYDKIGVPFVYSRVETNQTSEETIETVGGYTKIDLKDPNAISNTGVDLKNVEGYEKDGWVLNDKDRNKIAIAKYAEVTKNEPNNSIAWYNLANALKRQGLYNQALQALDSALVIDPEYAAAWRNKGQILNQMGNKTGADEATAKAKELTK
jgi:tetratricopeptide (TPR) repeat protein